MEELGLSEFHPEIIDATEAVIGQYAANGGEVEILADEWTPERQAVADYLDDLADLGMEGYVPIAYKLGSSDNADLVEAVKEPNVLRFDWVDFSSELPENAQKLFEALFADPDLALRETIEPGKSEKIHEREAKSFTRIRAKDLDELEDGSGRRFIHELYVGKMLDEVRAVFGEQIVPFEGDELLFAFVGNGLIEEEDEFPVHKDTFGTVSVLLFLSTNVSGEFYVSFEQNISDGEELRRRRGVTVTPTANWGMIFNGEDKWHGSGPIGDGAPERITIAFSYKDTKKYEGRSDKEFSKYRTVA